MNGTCTWFGRMRDRPISDKSVRSVMNTVIKNIFCPQNVAMGILCWISKSPNRWTRPMFVRVFTDYFKGDFQKHGKQVYYEHYNKVRSLVCKEDLLEYRVEDGWKPLCDFLSLDIPNVPFPNGNRKEEIGRRIQAMVHGEVRRLVELAPFYVTYLACFSLGLCLLRWVVSAIARLLI
jgi:hypothetical protein